LHLRSDEELSKLGANLSIADGNSLRKEIKANYSNAASNSAFIDKVDKLVLKALQIANINNHLAQKESSGWTTDLVPFVAVLLSKFRKDMKQVAPQELITTLALDVSYNENAFSPFRNLLVDSLTRLDLILTDYEGVPSNYGIFNTKIGKIPFTDVVLLDKKKLFDLIENHPEWGSYGHDIKVSQNTSELIAKNGAENAEYDDLINDTLVDEQQLMSQVIKSNIKYDNTVSGEY